MIRIVVRHATGGGCAILSRRVIGAVGPYHSHLLAKGNYVVRGVGGFEGPGGDEVDEGSVYRHCCFIGVVYVDSRVCLRYRVKILHLTGC